MQYHFCGHPLTAELRFCPMCGTKIMTTRGAVQEMPTARIMLPQVRPVHRPAVGQPGADRPERRLWLVLLIAFLTLSLLALCLIK